MIKFSYKDINTRHINKGAEMELLDYLDNIENKLKSSFDIARNYELNNYTYDLYARYYLRNEKYMLVKKAKVYAFENNEYCLIKYFKELDEKSLDLFIKSLIEAIDIIVTPSSEHMSSVITGVILTYNILEKEKAIKIIEKFRYHKGFAFGFKGWADIRLILVSLNEGLIAYNKKGGEVKEVYNIVPIA